MYARSLASRGEARFIDLRKKEEDEKEKEK